MNFVISCRTAIGIKTEMPVSIHAEISVTLKRAAQKTHESFNILASRIRTVNIIIYSCHTAISMDAFVFMCDTCFSSIS